MEIIEKHELDIVEAHASLCRYECYDCDCNHDCTSDDSSEICWSYN